LALYLIYPEDSFLWLDRLSTSKINAAKPLIEKAKHIRFKFQHNWHKQEFETFVKCLPENLDSICLYMQITDINRIISTIESSLAGKTTFNFKIIIEKIQKDNRAEPTEFEKELYQQVEKYNSQHNPPSQVEDYYSVLSNNEECKVYSTQPPQVNLPALINFLQQQVVEQSKQISNLTETVKTLGANYSRLLVKRSSSVAGLLLPIEVNEDECGQESGNDANASEEWRVMFG